MTLTKIFVFFIFLFSLTNLKANTVKQYFIKISPNQNLVNCGKLKVLKTKTNLEFFVQNQKVDIIEPKEALEWINDSIAKQHPDSSKVLFFVHGFWASLRFAIHRTAKEFEASYFADKSTNLVSIVHVFWDANDISYKIALRNLRNSTKTFAQVLNNINNTLNFKTSLMCHSMGNRFLHKTLVEQIVTVSFEHLILMAPDLDYRKFEEKPSLFTALSKDINVFYNQKDKTLQMSKGINKIERLGRLNKSNIDKNIKFIDCTNLKDIETLSDSVMKHLYYLTSNTVKKQIAQILTN